MGCGCKKRTNGTRAMATENVLRFLYCPSCDAVRSKRCAAAALSKERCPACSGKPVVFARPPTAQRLRREKERRTPDGPSSGGE